MAEDASKQGAAQAQGQEEPNYAQIREELQRENYDEPSEWLKGGYSDDIPDDGGSGEAQTEDEDEPAGEPLEGPSTGASKRRITYNGANYDLDDMGLEELAKRGIEYSSVKSKLLPYANVIAAIEADPRLGEAIANTIRNYRSGIPLAQPQPEAQPQDPDKEPEIGEDEDYDSYEKRLAAWRDARNQRLIDEKIAAHLRGMQERDRQAQIAEANQQIINYVQADPERERVLNVIASNSFPPGLRQQMEFDGPLFMSVYDSIRRDLGLQSYFGAPALWGKAQTRQAARPKSAGTPAPFAESGKTNSGGNRGGVSADSLPDFKSMSDDEFRAFKARVLFSEF